jgi:AcrR family transcriptional regulator
MTTSETLGEPGLRERKKAKTRAAIKQEAFRLFRAKGYEATTVEQIAAAAEISTTTFFRYFAAKEDLVLREEFDSQTLEEFRSSLGELGPVGALRSAMAAAHARMSPAELQLWREGMRIVTEVPELRARMLDKFFSTAQAFGQIMAGHGDRTADDFDVRVFAGAMVGVMMTVMHEAAQRPGSDLAELMGVALARLEDGLKPRDRAPGPHGAKLSRNGPP